MMKELIGGSVARSGREAYHDTRWAEDIKIESDDYEDAEEAEDADRLEQITRRPDREMKIEVPTPADPKSIFLESARLRNKDAKQLGVVKVPERDTKVSPRTVTPHFDTELVDVLSKISTLLDGSDLPEAQSLLESLKRRLLLSSPKVETVLETLDGMLNCIDGDTASLTLTSRANGRVYYAQYPAAEFAEKGIEEEDRFICKTVETDGGTRIEIEAIPDVELTDEHIRAIREKINKVLPRNDPGVRY